MKDNLNLFVIADTKPVNTRNSPSVYTTFKAYAIFCFLNFQLPFQNVFTDKVGNLKFNLKSKIFITMTTLLLCCLIFHSLNFLTPKVRSDWFHLCLAAIHITNALVILICSHYGFPYFIKFLKAIDEHNFELSKLPEFTFEERKKICDYSFLFIASLFQGLLYFGSSCSEFRKINNITFLSVVSVIPNILSCTFIHTFVGLNTMLYMFMCRELTICFRQFNKSLCNYIFKVVNNANITDDRTYLDDYRLLHLKMNNSILTLNEAFNFRIVYFHLMLFEFSLLAIFIMIFFIKHANIWVILSIAINCAIIQLISSHSDTLVNEVRNKY